MDTQNYHSRIFGIDLNSVMARPNQKFIPSIIKEMILTIYKNGLKENGIFRRSPLLNEVYAAKKNVDCDAGIGIIKYIDLHMISALLKLYFKELPGSLFTHELYDNFMENYENVRMIKQIFTKLPAHNEHLAEVLLILLGLVAQNGESNNVTANELALIFSTILLRPASENLETLTDLPKRTTILLTILMNLDNFFPENNLFTIIGYQELPPIVLQKLKLENYKKNFQDAILKTKNQFNDINMAIKGVTETNDPVQLKNFLDDICKKLAEYEFKPSDITEKFPITSTTFLESGHSSLQGARRTMEDRVCIIDNLNKDYPILPTEVNCAFYAIFDGHAGDEVSNLASSLVLNDIINNYEFSCGDPRVAIRNGLIKADDQIVETANIEGWNSGSTVVLVFIIRETLYVANLGDSEALLCRRESNSGDTGHHRIPIVLSKKHKPTDDKERDRIMGLGAAVYKGRIFGRLAVSRGLGDAEFKKPKAKANYVSSEPSVLQYNLTSSDEFIILACDGLWDKVGYQEAIDYIHNLLTFNRSVKEISKSLAKYAIEKGSKDNVTVIIVKLNWKPVNSHYWKKF